jgi:hypothetical protein
MAGFPEADGGIIFIIVMFHERFAVVWARLQAGTAM